MGSIPIVGSRCRLAIGMPGWNEYAPDLEQATLLLHIELWTVTQVANGD